MQELKYDLAILGSGPGGYVAAIRAASKGLKVALVEKEKVGGMCLNWGCIPSKALLSTALLFSKIRKGESFGLTGVPFKEIKPDWPKMNERAFGVVKRLTKGVETLLSKRKVDVHNGLGSFTKEGIQVDDKLIKAKSFILATGSYYSPLWEKPAAVDTYTPKNIYKMEKLPTQITIVGGGVVGVEFAILFALLGVKVDVVEKQKSLMAYLDESLLSALTRNLKKLRIKIHAGFEPCEYDKKQGLHIVKDEQFKYLPSEVILNCTTRKASEEGLEYLREKGLTWENGFVKTNLRCQTSIPNYYAIGDCNGRKLLANVAIKEAIAAVDDILGHGTDLNYNKMPYYMYGQYEYASVGMSEEQAKQDKLDYNAAVFPLRANAKSLIDEGADGFIKFITDNELDEIIGIHVMSPQATEIINQAVTSMNLESTSWDIGNMVYTHPSVSESFFETALKGENLPLHIL